MIISTKDDYESTKQLTHQSQLPCLNRIYIPPHHENLIYLRNVDKLYIFPTTNKKHMFFFLTKEAYVLRGPFNEYFVREDKQNANEKETKTGDFLHQIRT